jgi:hypothetical protein
MKLFKSSAKPDTKADMLAKMRTDNEAAVARASKFGIHSREIATTLEAPAPIAVVRGDTASDSRVAGATDHRGLPLGISTDLPGA